MIRRSRPMPASPPRRAGRAIIWVLLVLAVTAGVGIPIYRAASQSSMSTPEASTAISGDTVQVAAGTYSGTFDIQSKDITINAVGGGDVTLY
jgi:uncharacterized protein with FMN-binding domain